MNCHTCGYALWNLRTRQCPECGEHFAISQFEFVPNAVAFCCPFCDQPYYGTGEKGHLVPLEFVCVTCGQLANMDLMIVRPAEGVRERETQVDRVPWLAPDEGWIKPLLKTIWSSLITPHRLGMGMRPDQPLAQAWLYAGIVLAFVVGITAVSCLGFYGFMFALAGPGPGAMFMLWPMLAFFVFSFVAAYVGIAYWGALAHLLLKMTGETHTTIGRTFECICYSSGANIASAVPCVGFYFGWIWWMVSAILTLKEGQRVSGGRAALAGIVPPTLVILLLIGSNVAMMMVASRAIGAAGAFPGPTAPLATTPADAATATRNLTRNVNAFASQGMPGHASEMIPAGFASPAMFIIRSTNTALGDVPVGGAGGSHLREIELLDVGEQEQIALQAASQLPQNVIAHRLGDFVFTYHGTTIRADMRLWLLIASPDPDVNEATSFNGPIFVGTAFGNVQTISEDRFAQELEAQNRVRVGHGLAPLPHPREVTHERPAVAGD